MYLNMEQDILLLWLEQHLNIRIPTMPKVIMANKPLKAIGHSNLISKVTKILIRLIPPCQQLRYQLIPTANKTQVSLILHLSILNRTLMPPLLIQKF